MVGCNAEVISSYFNFFIFSNANKGPFFLRVSEMLYCRNLHVKKNSSSECGLVGARRVAGKF